MVRQAVERISSGLDDPPDFRALAAAAYVSPYHFHRIFAALAGEPAAALVRRLRLERAAHQLTRTGASVRDVATAAGYGTSEAFAKAFTAAYGVAPSVFRAENRPCVGLRAPSGLHVVGDGFSPFEIIHIGGETVRVETVELPTRRLAAVRHTGPYWQIGRAFGELARRAGPLGLLAGPDVLTAAVFYDDQASVPEAELRSVAGVTVTDGAAIGDLVEATLPGGRFRRATYVGHPSGLPQAWGALYRHHLDGFRLRVEPCFEVYVTGHDGPPEKMRTDLYAPVE
jgi:AraC family transcriptional regulator